MRKIITIREFMAILAIGLATWATLHPMLMAVDLGTTAYLNGGM